MSDLTAKLNSVFFMMFQGNGTIGLCLSQSFSVLPVITVFRYFVYSTRCNLCMECLSTLPSIEAVEKDKDSECVLDRYDSFSLYGYEDHTFDSSVSVQRSFFGISVW